jgi:hypothetical protein
MDSSLDFFWTNQRAPISLNIEGELYKAKGEKKELGPLVRANWKKASY